MSSPQRTLVVSNRWPRDPKGKPLPNPPPRGTRPPNGIIWAHSLNDYFWIQRIPNINVMTIWSRSMIREFGENFLAQEHEAEPGPELLKPWPVLTILPDDSQNSQVLDSVTKDDESLATNLPISNDNGELLASTVVEDASQTRHDNAISLEENKPQDIVYPCSDSLQKPDSRTIEMADTDSDEVINRESLLPPPPANITGGDVDFRKNDTPPSKNNDILTSSPSESSSSTINHESMVLEDDAGVSSISIPNDGQDSIPNPSSQNFFDESNNQNGDDASKTTTKILETPLSFHGCLVNEAASEHQSDLTTIDKTEAETSLLDVTTNCSKPRSRTSLNFDSAVSLDLPTSEADFHDHAPDSGSPESWVCMQDYSNSLSATPAKNPDDISLVEKQKELGSPPRPDDDIISQAINKEQYVACLCNVTTNHTCENGKLDDQDMAIVATTKSDIMPSTEVQNDLVVKEMPDEQTTTALKRGDSNESSAHKNVETKELETTNQSEIVPEPAAADNTMAYDKPREDASHQNLADKDSPEESDKEMKEVQLFKLSSTCTGMAFSGGYGTDDGLALSETAVEPSDKISLVEEKQEVGTPFRTDDAIISQVTDKEQHVTCLGNVATYHAEETKKLDAEDVPIVATKPDIVPSTAVQNEFVKEMPDGQTATLSDNNESSTHENVEPMELETINQSEIVSEPTDSITASDKPKEDVDHQDSGDKDPPEESDKEKKDVKINLPKLEEFIPNEYFPDILNVHDPLDYTRPLIMRSYLGVEVHGQEGGGAPALKRYKRVWPQFPRDGEPGTLFNTNPRSASIAFDSQETITPDAQLNVGCLDLSGNDIIGTGNHSAVFRAPLQLPHPLSANSPTNKVTVAAKTAILNYEARQLLNNEAHIYSKLPKHLMEHYTGFHLVKPCAHPVPVNAIVPKFFGFYVPVREEIEAERRSRTKAKIQRIAKRKARREAKENMDANCEKDVNVAVGVTDTSEHGESEETSEDSDDDYDDYDDDNPIVRRDALSPILLLEECGTPVVPREFTPDERSACYSAMLRLHHACFSQNSFYVRNILRQPGPINLPPHLRSDKTPIFRIIDFGRGEHLWTLVRQKLRKENLTQPQITVLNQECFLKREAEHKRRDAVTRQAVKEWVDQKNYDVRKAQTELEIFNFDF